MPRGPLTRRCLVSNFFLAGIAWPLAGHAQQSAKIPCIGYLDFGGGMLPNGGFAPFHNIYRRGPFLEGLREVGWVEGQNVTIERRFAVGQTDRLPALAAELLALDVDVIVAAATPAAKAVQSATSKVPVVIADPGDPVQLGLVASLARPGANITGVISIAPDLATKRLALLKEAVPKATRVAILWNSAIPPAEVALKELRAAAPVLDITLQFVEAQGQAGLAESLATLVREHADALFVFPDPLTFGNRDLIAGFANKNSIPALFGAREFVDVGGLMSYGPDYPAMFRRAGNYAGRILKGTNPAELPVEQPTKFELIINLKAAKAFGFDIAPKLVARADEVIE